jgi:uncharacterized protein (DUF697 family)
VSRTGAIGPRALVGVLREVRGAKGAAAPLVVGGARELVGLLARELAAGGESGAVIEYRAGSGSPPTPAAALIWLGEADREALRAYSEAGVPIVGVTDGASLPYVLDTELVTLERGASLPVDEISKLLAGVLGADGVHLAARLPVLRGAVIDELIGSCARRNSVIAAAVFVPGADLPVLALNELRLVLRVALANGDAVGVARAPEVVGVLLAGFGARRIARALCGSLPLAGFALKGAVAYGATVAIGEAARTRFSLERSVRPGT